ncbi:MAG: serine/threonine-protein phosphatase [Lachnospiraceae bacterium]|nr:serine/threonine-protein phosphatase [Lachnospiraceae bacterium]
MLFAAVCDGIGGLWGGEKASGFVAERMTEWFYKEAVILLKKGRGRQRIEQSGIRALYGCNQELCRFGERKGRKLGTAVTAVLLDGRQYFLWHSGDTRAYRIGRRMGRFKRLTRDHVAGKHALVRCIGSFPWQQPDVQRGHLGQMEALLLCSDGFRNRMAEEKLAEALSSRALICREQIFLRLKEIGSHARRHGETDDISAVLIKRI